MVVQEVMVATNRSKKHKHFIDILSATDLIILRTLPGFFEIFKS